MWDLPGPGLEPVSPALAGRFLTTAPPGKSLPSGFYGDIFCIRLYSGIPRPWKQLFLILGGSAEMQAGWNLPPPGLLLGAALPHFPRWVHLDENRVCVNQFCPAGPIYWVGPPHLQVLYPPVQPTMDWKYSGKKIPESSRKQNLNLPRAISIYIAFTLYSQLFTLHVCCISYYK